MMNKIIKFLNILLGMMLLTSCTHSPSQFVLPNRIHFENEIYVPVTDNQIEEMRQLLYLPQSGELNPNNWHKGILIFLDKNSSNLTLAQRIQLRQQNFAKNPAIQAVIYPQHNELWSEVIYPPTDQFITAQIEISRGKNLLCGYAQIQLSQAVSKTQNADTQLKQLKILFHHLSWPIQCRT